MKRNQSQHGPLFESSRGASRSQSPPSRWASLCFQHVRSQYATFPTRPHLPTKVIQVLITSCPDNCDWLWSLSKQYIPEPLTFGPKCWLWFLTKSPRRSWVKTSFHSWQTILTQFGIQFKLIVTLWMVAKQWAIRAVSHTCQTMPGHYLTFIDPV